APNNKILLNDDADLIAETYGLYNVNDYTKEHERNVIRCGLPTLREQLEQQLFTLAISD
ncbi:unnamed protein product, partial [Rotaria magnacalcarata]